MDNGKYSNKSFFKRLIVFSNEKPIKFLIKIGFGFLNAILLYSLLFLFISVMVDTVGITTDFVSVLNPFISLRHEYHDSEIVIPDGYTLYAYHDDDDEFIRYWVQNWQSDFVIVEIPKMPCDRDFKIDFWNEFIEEPKPISVKSLGHLTSVYRFDNTEVYIRRMGGPELPRFFCYSYFACIPDKCTNIVLIDNAPNMRKLLNLVDQIAFNGETSKTEFIKNVRGY